MSVLSVIVDSREPDWVKGLKFGTVPVAVGELGAGDLLIATSDNYLLAVERKTPNDLLNSIKDNRLFNQAAGMRALTPWAYVIVTGELRRGTDGKVTTDRITGWEWSSVMGALLEVQELGVFVAFCAGDFEFEAAVMRVANRNRTDIAISPPPVATHVLDVGENIIANLPGIGLERLSAIMKYCGSPIWALVALTDQSLDGVPGVGKGIKSNIRKALGMPDWMNIELATKEGELS